MKRIDFSRIWRYVKGDIPFFNRERSGYLICTCAGDRNKPDVHEFEKILIGMGYQYNYFSYTEHGQLSNMRKLYTSGINDEVFRQVHIRLFDDGSVHAHDEFTYEYDAIGHINGVTLRELDYIDKMSIVDKLTESLL